jgi:hypothetical protein
LYYRKAHLKEGFIMSKLNHTFLNTALVALAAAPLIFIGCSKSDDTAATPSVGVSGKLSTTSSAAGKTTSIPEEQVVGSAINLATYKVACVIATTPPTFATSAVDASGNFSISIPNGTGQPMSCSLIDSNDTKVADFLIADSSTKSMDGSSTSYTNSATYKSDAALGTINYDSNAGEVTIPKSVIASLIDTSAATAPAYDPTGLWTVKGIDFTLPKGAVGPCATGGDNCNGPVIDQPLYMKRWDGKRTADQSAVYGLQLWQSQATAKQCGDGTTPFVGLSTSEKTAFGVDFSANAAADAQFNFPTTIAASSGFKDGANGDSQNAVTLTARGGITEPAWQMSTATTRYQYTTGCGMKDLTKSGVTYHAYACGPDNAAHYMFNITGGCVNTSTSAPVQVSDWTGITSCTNTIDASTGIRSNVCTGTSGSTAVTCTNTWLISTDAAGATPDLNNGDNFNWGTGGMTTVAQGTACSSGALGALDKLKCYSDYYWSSGLSNYSGACVPKIDTDWTATTAAAFINVNYKPNGLIFFEEYKPFADGSGGTLTSRDTQFRGVQVSSNNYVSCQVIDTGALTLRKVSATKILAQYQSSQITTNTNKPACQAAFTGARKTFVFYMTK